MAEEKEPTPDYTSVKGLKSLARLVPERLSLKAQEKQIKARVKEIDDSIMPLLVRAGMKSVMVNEEPVTLVEGSYPSFDKKKLVEIPFPCPHCRQKVTLPPTVVQKATIMKDRAPYLSVGRRTREEEE